MPTAQNYSGHDRMVVAFNEKCDREAREDDLVPGYAMSYEAWLDWTGKDDSFKGSFSLGIPGTADLYEAVMRVGGFEKDHDADDSAPAPTGP